VTVLKALGFSGLAVLFAAGALLAGVVATGGRAADTTTTEQTTVTETTTEPATTTTVQQTTTRRVIVPTTTGTTTSGSESGSDIPDWVWVVIGLLALGLIVLLVVLLTRRGGGSVSAEERQRRLAGAVGSWTMQGWAVDSQTADSAVLRRGSELMQISVDSAGGITTRPLQP
jgi:hypothetical protein